MVAAGGIVLASEVNLAGLKVIRRGNRMSQGSNFGATETGYLRVDNIPLRNNRIYYAAVNNLGVNVDGTSDAILIRLRMSTTGIATTSSTEICAYRMSEGNIDPFVSFVAPFPISADTSVASIMITGVRTGGVNTAHSLGSVGNGCNLLIIDGGEDPGDTGIDI